MNIFSQRARLADAWAENVRLKISDGQIKKIRIGVKPDSADIKVDTLLPALANLHSHSFQRAMAGMTEYRSAGRENFWTWRELMYRFLDHLTPEDISTIAALTFMEMQKSGYASVGEFHYIHHQKSGHAYDNPAELSERIIEAANLTGIGLTHLPVLYTYGGLQNQTLEGGQLRFGNSVDDICKIVSISQKTIGLLPADARVGIAPHSLRATSPSDIQEFLNCYTDMQVHMHIAEQTKEVSEVVEAFGARPVEWLLEHHAVDTKWCLIHATHMTQAETIGLAKTGAVVGLCPITESNLGDGIFDGPIFLKANGKFGIGSDSNINISLTEELRTLEYSQRLRDQQRNVMIQGDGSVGEALYLGAANSGAQALAREAGSITPGKLADLIAIDSSHPSLCALHDIQLMDGLVFAAKDTVITDVWSAGRHQVRNGMHVAEDTIKASYFDTISTLKERLGS
ncbi:MAG: formimidoylglutamate deiminase [Paracoccaceae bacterium]|jgi:formimidoylglutamate deiminase|nr:formimidoylglutamate deiminase [Paracoccaceae bacterium]